MGTNTGTETISIGANGVSYYNIVVSNGLTTFNTNVVAVNDVSAGSLNVSGAATMRSGLTVSGGDISAGNITGWKITATTGLTTNSPIVPSYRGRKITTIGSLGAGATVLFTPPLTVGLYSLTLSYIHSGIVGVPQTQLSTMYYSDGTEIVSGGVAKSDVLFGSGYLSMAPNADSSNKYTIIAISNGTSQVLPLNAYIVQLLGEVTYD